MIIAKVIGTVVATVKHPVFQARKIMLVQPLHLPGEKPDDAFVALDAAQAGVGDTVLVCQEGGSARQIFRAPDTPLRSTIVGVIDAVNLVW